MRTPAAYYRLINPHRSNTFCMNAVLIYIPCTHIAFFFIQKNHIVMDSPEPMPTPRHAQWNDIFLLVRRVCSKVFSHSKLINSWINDLTGLHVGIGELGAIWFYFGVCVADAHNSASYIDAEKSRTSNNTRNATYSTLTHLNAHTLLIMV